MRLVLDRIEISDGGVSTWMGRPDGAGDSGAFAVAASVVDGWGDEHRSGAGAVERWSWWVARADDTPAPVRAVRLVFRVLDVTGRLRMLRHGYQSWSPTDVAVFGEDRDRSLAAGSMDWLRAINQADQRMVTHPDELRSEWVTVLIDDDDVPLLVGFDGGDRHDGTLRLRTGPTGIELCGEAFLGDVTLAPGERRDLHELFVATSAPVDSLLADWATAVGRRGGARTDADFRVGWCSWYQYFHDITRIDIDANLALVDDWPFDVFQVDDGYQSAIGDWLTVDERFGGDLESMAVAIEGAGRCPGLWLAPFLAAPDSRVATEHPEWLARGADGDPLFNMYNPPWGGGRDGVMFGLDPTVPEVREHLRSLAATVVSMGYRYLKLDFTFSPSFDGVWRDRSFTAAQRVRAGLAAIREGAGDEVFLLGCGVPLANSVGIVDGNRIGADVAPSWNRRVDEWPLPGYAETQPAARHAWAATAARSFMHRRLWLNDPDCVLLRSARTDLTPEAARTWARAVGLSGGMVVVSDDLSLLGAEARDLLDETVALGRMADDAARVGSVARSPGLLDGAEPSTLQSPAGALSVAVDDGRSTFAPVR